MAPVNVAECHVEAGVSQQADITVLTKKIDDSQFLDTSFLDLPFEVQCHFFRQAPTNNFTLFFPQLKQLFTDNSPGNHIILGQINYLVLCGRHLTKQELTRCRIAEIAPGSFKVAEVNSCYWENISLEHFSRVFAHCHILCLHLDVVSVLFVFSNSNILNITSDFCDQMHDFFHKNKITVGNLALLRLTIIDRLLRTTEASFRKVCQCNSSFGLRLFCFFF
uniref:Leucine rich repeats-containing protein n=1 Tax=Heterorhabditis bacteriophora TaxID=37862 RepID=A0A1I7WLN8_HETBA